MIVALSDRVIDAAAALMAVEHRSTLDRGAPVPVPYVDPMVCREALADLLERGCSGSVAMETARCVGVMCGQTFGNVGFVPAHGMSIDPLAGEPTAIVVALFAELAPNLVERGAIRVTVDHVEHPPLTMALHDAGFGGHGVFAVRGTERIDAASSSEVRVGTADDLDVIAELSHVELLHRSTPPIYAFDSPRTLAAARALHADLLDAGAVHLMARRNGADVGLLTIEHESPAPRLCAATTPYIGATATHPDARHHGVGRALVSAAVDWARTNGHDAISVDFESMNPLSRPFWLGVGFRPTGYRVRRVLGPLSSRGA